jgi:SAM-dependent methyltransferase
MTLPLLTHVMLKRGQPEGAVGKVYGLNTFGAIMGAVLAGLVFMPMIGLKGVIVLGALVDMLLGLALIRAEIASGRAPANTPRHLRTAAVGTVFAICTGLLMRVDPAVLTATVFRNGRIKLPEEYEVLSYVDGRTASVTVVKTDIKSGHHVIYTNGKPDASIVLDRWPADRDPMEGPEIAGDEPNQFLVGLVPLMARPDSKHVALIGFGSGVTCHTLLASPAIERVDTVEIEPEMVEGSRYFMPVNYRAYTDPRSHIHFDDAKAYFAWAGDKYDIIVSEPTNPWVSGVSSLFTVEFYQEVKRYLKPDGLLAQWIQGYELSDELFISVLAALDREFNDYLVVRIGSSDWVILSSPNGTIGDLSEIPLAWPEAQESFELLGIHDMGQIDGLITANKRILHPFLADKMPNRDSLPILDTGAEKARFLKYRADFLHRVRWAPAPLLEVFGGIHRRAYPAAGIGDNRDPHILHETEQAALLMRRYVNPDVRVGGGELSAETMSTWRDANGNVQLVSSPDWYDWLEATWAVYELVAPHIDLAQEPWWREVLSVAARKDVPDDVRESIELLDALVVQDGDRIWKVVDRTIALEDFPLSKQIRAVAGIVALELRGVDAKQRQGFVDKHMRDLGTGGSNEDYALRVLKSYAARP